MKVKRLISKDFLGETMRLSSTICLLVFVSAAHAQNPVLKPGFNECVAESVSNGAPIIGCVADAHEQCAEFEPESAAELACYLTAKEEWGEQISDLLASFSDKSPDLQEVVRIEAKYAVLRNLMNCDLRLELSLVGREPEPKDQTAKAKCEALATSAGLTEVLFKSGTITRPPN